jgi:hypothetical protein
MQKVLRILTFRPDLRGEAVGWSCDDGDLVQPGPIGRTPGPRFAHSYGTPLHAIGAGWRLLAPPLPPEDEDDPMDGYDWWLVRDDVP